MGLLAAGGCGLARQGLLAEAGDGDGGATSSGGGTSSGGATSSGGGGSGGSTSSGGGGSHPEDCLNGEDDDGDTAVDCDDSDCQPGFECMPADSAALAYLMEVPADENCPADTSSVTALSACDCSCPPTAGTCTIQVSVDDSSGCGSPIATVASGSCNNGPQNGSTRYFRLEQVVNDQNAQCSDGTTTVAPSTTPLCAISSVGTCAGGQVCVPVVPERLRTCIRVAAPGSCPSAFPVERSGLLGAPDGNCGCTCTTNGSTCQGAYTTVYHSPNDCTGSDTQEVSLTLGQCSAAISDVDAHFVPAIESVPACSLDVTLSGTTETTVCCTS